MTELQKRLHLAGRDATDEVRHLVDGEGTRWLVYEQAFSEYDRRRGLSLIFASDTVVRRVRHYPDGWRALSDDALLALSWNA